MHLFPLLGARFPSGLLCGSIPAGGIVSRIGHGVALRKRIQ